MPEFLKVGDTVVNLDRTTSVDLRRRVQHPDVARRAAAPHKNGSYEAVRINIADQSEPITLFDDEADAARKYFEGEANDITPEKDPKEAEADRIQAEADSGDARSGIIDSERLHAATSAGQDRVGAADLRPPATRTTPPPGTAPASEITVPSRTAGQHATPVEAKGLVDAAATVKADDERREAEGKERTAELPKYASDRSGEAPKEDKGKSDHPESKHVDTGTGPPQNLASLSDAPVARHTKDEKSSKGSGKH